MVKCLFKVINKGTKGTLREFGHSVTSSLILTLDMLSFSKLPILHHSDGNGMLQASLLLTFAVSALVWYVSEISLLF